MSFVIFMENHWPVIPCAYRWVSSSWALLKSEAMYRKWWAFWFSISYWLVSSGWLWCALTFVLKFGRWIVWFKFWEFMDFSVNHHRYYLPRRKKLTKLMENVRFGFYAFIAFGIPFGLVLWAYSRRLPGMPSYYLKGVTEETRASQDYFIPPISSILFVCFGLLVSSYFGFRKIEAMLIVASKDEEYAKQLNGIGSSTGSITIQQYKHT